jgi:hypothetical protein
MAFRRAWPAEDIKIMARTREQCERFAFEANLVARYMGHYRFFNPRGDTYVEGVARRSGWTNAYRARLTLPTDYPHQRPELCVLNPRTLPLREPRVSLNRMGLSHAYHTNGTDAHGNVHICYTQNWKASMTCVFVLKKLALWLEAYEEHLCTGEIIDAILRRWSQDEQ